MSRYSRDRSDNSRPSRIPEFFLNCVAFLVPVIVGATSGLSAALTALSTAPAHGDVAGAEDSPASALVAVPPGIRIETPSFVLDDLSGTQNELAKTRANVVLVHFFATWCEPCREELPALQRLIERDAASHVAVLIVSVGEPDDRVRRFFAGMQLSFPVLLDRDRRVAKAWHVETLPSTFALNRKLEARLKVEGEFAWDRISPQELSERVGLYDRLPRKDGD